MVHGSPTGRRAVSNALASFWAFQGWGNDPQLFSEAFKSTVDKVRQTTRERFAEFRKAQRAA